MSQCFLYNVQNDSPTRMDEREAFFRPASVFGLLQRELRKKLPFKEAKTFIPGSATVS